MESYAPTSTMATWMQVCSEQNAENSMTSTDWTWTSMTPVPTHRTQQPWPTAEMTWGKRASWGRFLHQPSCASGGDGRVSRVENAWNLWGRSWKSEPRFLKVKILHVQVLFFAKSILTEMYISLKSMFHLSPCMSMFHGKKKKCSFALGTSLMRRTNPWRANRQRSRKMSDPEGH